MTAHAASSLGCEDKTAHRSDLSCPCCGTASAQGYWAVIAPFIRALVQPCHSSLVQLLQCSRCDHRFFNYQYTDEDMRRLYGGYRGDHYFQIRHRLEPWYGSKTNSANLDPALIQARQESLLAFLLPLLPSTEQGLVIADLGGDAGQFLPLQLAREAYLIEASDQPPVAGVMRVSTMAALPANLDLLICAHVLEHLPDPIEFLRSHLSSALIRKGCLIYLEVPLERYGVADQLRSQIYSRYLRLLVRSQPILIFMDFLSVLARSYLGWIFPPLIIKMHEHVNFFTSDSLRACINSLGLDLIAIHQDGGSALSTHQGVIRALARWR